MTLSSLSCADLQAEGENEVNNELANRISLFYADATPMLKTLSDGTTKFVSEVRRTVFILDACSIDFVCRIQTVNFLSEATVVPGLQQRIIFASIYRH